MSSLISSVAWYVETPTSIYFETIKRKWKTNSNDNNNHTYRVKRGVAAQHPQKYNLDETELERVSALARIELEDARVELERAHAAAEEMGKGAEGSEADDADDDDAWVE